jgi:hypothetical protein
MTTVERLEVQVQQLAPPDFEKFRQWFHAYEWQIWDGKLERDSKAGKLKELAAKALADHAAGRTSRMTTITPTPISGFVTEICLKTCNSLPTKLLSC